MKKRFVLIGLLLTLAFSTSACSHKNISISKSEILKGSPFVEIPGEEELVYHTRSHSIYVIHFYKDNQVTQNYSISAPYIQNGHFCEYRNNEIVEIIN